VVKTEDAEAELTGTVVACDLDPILLNRPNIPMVLLENPMLTRSDPGFA
jgi:hypothetical protein